MFTESFSTRPKSYGRMNVLSALFVIFFIAGNGFSQDTIVIQPGPSESKDCVIDSRLNTSSFPNHKDFMGVAWTVNGTPVTTRALIDFDLSAVPTNEPILSAKLSLYGHPQSVNGDHSSMSGSNESVIQMIVDPWDETTTTWNNQPMVSTTNQVTLAQSNTSYQNYENIDVTALIQEMIDNPTARHGLMYRLVTEQYYRRMIFASSDALDPTIRPKLVIILNSATELAIEGAGDVCKDESTILRAIGGTGHRWAKTNDPNTTIGWGDSISVSPAVQTDYSVFSSEGDTATHLVEVIDFDFDLGSDTILCEGEKLNLNAYVSNASYNWQDGSISESYLVETQGVYSVDVLLNGCLKSDEIKVEFTIIEVDLGEDRGLCFDENIVLVAQWPNATYTWQDGSTAASFEVNEPGVFYVAVKEGNCQIIDSVEYRAVPDQFFDLGEDIEICEGNSVELSALHPEASYLWQNGTTSPVFDAGSTGKFALIRTIDGCSGFDSVYVKVIQYPNAYLGPDATLCLEKDEIYLDVYNDDASYLWNDGSEESFKTVTSGGTYTVEVFIGECSRTDTVHYDFVECVEWVYVNFEMPNVFTPDGDGVNDLFVPIDTEGIVEMKTRIFNRWGNLVFETDEIDFSWSGEDLISGNYFWFVEYTDGNKVFKKVNGTVYLTR